tara:strand:- start:83 stop:373 length:291 start_codon:yes stop_codon:yes gene_type:complete
MVINMGRIKRLGVLTRQEENWLDTLERSSINTRTPFSATEASRAIAATPNKKGHILKVVPNPRKTAYILRKSQRYVRWNKPKINNKTTVYWVKKLD